MIINDMHIHLREGNLLEKVKSPSLQYISNALAMPNLKNNPVVDLQSLENYILEVFDHRVYYTVYLSKKLDKKELLKLKEHPRFKGIKLYPLGVTTNSDLGVSETDLIQLPVWLQLILSNMEELSIPLLIHGEMPSSPKLDAETDFLPLVEKMLLRYPKLNIVLEHITKKETVDFVKKHNIMATITAHHLLITVDDVLGNMLNYCKPVAKNKVDRYALLNAVKYNNFMFGSDSAPHSNIDKLRGAAGCYTAPILPYLLRKIFNEYDEPSAFLYKRAEIFYKLPQNYYAFSIPDTPHPIETEINSIPLFMGGRYL